ncbi:MAG: hypothetical protein ROR55_26770 [Devosia sp.]
MGGAQPSVWRAAAVPQAWRGAWQRRLLVEPDGSQDHKTFVVWLQSGSHYADIRLPAGRPPMDSRGFAHLDRRAVSYLAQQEGFAGRLYWRGGRARWERRIDFAPLSGPPDEGRLARSGQRLIEHGIHRAYREEWWQMGAPGPSAVLMDTPRRMLLRVGKHFILVDDRRPAPLSKGALPDAAVTADAASRAALLGCEISYGHVEGRRFRVLRSTLPWREGALVLPRFPSPRRRATVWPS